MDVIDQGCAREQLDRDLAAAMRKPAGPQPCGVCHNCGEPVPDVDRWCDQDCRDDWEARHASR